MSPLKRTRSVQPVPVLWLTLVWVVLWRDITWVNVVSGVLVAALVCFVFPLPPLRTRLRIRPIALAALVARFLHEVVLASAQVVRLTLTPGRVQNAVIEVRLRTPSDLVLTIVGQMLSLIPGSLLIEARRSTHTIYLHVLDVDDAADAEAAREHALALEARVVRALGVDLTSDTTDRRSPR